MRILKIDGVHYFSVYCFFWLPYKITFASADSDFSIFIYFL